MVNEKSVTIAIAGNPNCGKTSLFNSLTGATHKIGNWPGVTVEKKTGLCNYKGCKITVVDLPGTYSLSPYTLEEYIARREILSSHISGIIVVVDREE